MRTLERNEKTIYHSKRNLTEDGVEYYDVPVALKCNPMPVSVDWTRAGKGEIQTGLLKFMLSRDVYQDIVVEEGDKFYVDTTPPELYGDYVRAFGADYVVVGIEPTPTYIGVIIRRLAI